MARSTDLFEALNSVINRFQNPAGLFLYTWSRVVAGESRQSACFQNRLRYLGHSESPIWQRPARSSACPVWIVLRQLRDSARSRRAPAEIARNWPGPAGV